MSLPGKYLARVGKKKTLFDRRRLWASADRELVLWERPDGDDSTPSLSGGERAARRRFADLVTGGPKTPPVDPVTALRHALDLTGGNIPEYETREQFDAYWTDARLIEIANRWRESRFFRHLARAQVQAAHSKLGAAAEAAANTLVEIALNEKASTNARVKAAATILGSVGIIAGSKIEDSSEGKRQALKDKGKGVLGNVIPLPITSVGSGS